MSEVKVDKISPKTGTSMTVGDSGDTFTVPSGATLTVAGALSVTGSITATDKIDSAHYAAGSIDNEHLADDAVDSDELAAGSVDTAHIADDQVTLAKMAGLARGKIIYGDSSGNPAALTVGSNGQVLKSDGTDISWGTDSGGAALTGSTVNTLVTVTGANAISGESSLSYDGTNFKIGSAATPGGKLAVTSADSGATAHANADEIVCETNGTAGISILSFNNTTGNLYFGDGQDNDIGQVAYNHSDNSLAFVTNAAERLSITSDGRGLSQFTAKGWAHFDGTGTPSIDDSHNASSLSDTETGQIRVNFSNNMASANYCAIVNGWWGYAYTGGAMDMATDGFKATTSNGSSYTDVNSTMVLWFGD